MSQGNFTPALGYSALTGFYDAAIRLATREKRWRSLLLQGVAPLDGDYIIDVGCGTGTFAIMLKRAAPGARIVGLDPDPAALDRARKKAERVELDIEWRSGFAGDVSTFPSEFDKAVSSLVFHQVPVAEKRSGITGMFQCVKPGGEVHIADYARQRGWLMRSLFRSVQLLDGRENTQPNADGMIEQILAEIAGPRGVSKTGVRTATGEITLFRCARPKEMILVGDLLSHRSEGGVSLVRKQ